MAIKTLHHEYIQTNREEFLREARVMIGLNHHCVVRLIGLSRGPPLLMVLQCVLCYLLISIMLLAQRTAL